MWTRLGHHVYYQKHGFLDRKSHRDTIKPTVNLTTCRLNPPMI